MIMRIPVLSVLLLSLLSLLTACGRGGGSSAASTDQLDDFAKRSGLVIPASAKAIHYKHLGGMDERIDVSLEMPAAELVPFLKASGLDTEITNTTLASGLPAKFGTFVPKIPGKFREGQKQVPRNCWLNVLVDEDDPTTVLVHLTWFEV
jgi:hypothetical protein